MAAIELRPETVERYKAARNGSEAMRDVSDQSNKSSYEAIQDINQSPFEPLAWGMLKGASDIPRNILNAISSSVGGRSDFFPSAGIENHPSLQGKFGGGLGTAGEFLGSMLVAGGAGKGLGMMGLSLPAGKATIGSSIPSKLYTMLAGPANQVAGNALYGASQSPDDKARGAVSSGALSAAIESLPLVAKASRGLGQVLRPSDLTNRISDMIKPYYQMIEGTVSDVYKGVTDKYGKHRIDKGIPKEKLGFTDLIKNEKKADRLRSYLGEDEIPGVFSSFENTPSFNNAHDVHKVLGTEIGKLHKMSALDSKQQQKLNHLSSYRNKIEDQMDSMLKAKNPSAYNEFKLGRNLHKQQKLPFEKNEQIHNLALGRNTEDLGPTELLSALRDVVNSSGSKADKSRYIPEDHILSQMEKELSKGVKNSSLAKILGSGATALSLPFPANIASPFISHYLGEGALKHLQSPTLESILMKAKKPYRAAGRGVLANPNLLRQEQE